MPRKRNRKRVPLPSEQYIANAISKAVKGYLNRPVEQRGDFQYKYIPKETTGIVYLRIDYDVYDSMTGHVTHFIPLDSGAK